MKFNTDIIIFGLKLRIELIILAVIIGGITWLHLLGGCTTDMGFGQVGSLIREIIQTSKSILLPKREGYSDLTYSISEGVHNDKYEQKVGLSEVNVMGGVPLKPSAPLPEGQLFMWANNTFDAKCCETSNVSGGNGCACITKEQVDFLNNRGGNRGGCSQY